MSGETLLKELNLGVEAVTPHGLLDWLKRRKKKPDVEAAPVDEEKQAIERTRKLHTEIEGHLKEKPKRKKRRKEKGAQFAAKALTWRHSFLFRS